MKTTTLLLFFASISYAQTSPAEAMTRQVGPRAVSRSIQSKLNDFVSAKDFGACGNGTCDDTAAIQAALDSQKPMCGSVYLPPGVYKVSNTLTVDCTSLGGSGMKPAGGGATEIRSSSTTADILAIDRKNDKANDGSFVRIANLSLIAETRQTSGSALRISGNFISVDHLRILNAYDGITISREGSQNVFLSNNDVRVFHAGLHVSARLSGLRSRDNFFETLGTDAGFGWHLVDTNGFWSTDDEIYGTDIGIYADKSTQWFIKGLVVDSTRNAGMIIGKAAPCYDLEFVDSWWAGSKESHGVEIYKAGNIRFQGGFIRGNRKSGVYISANPVQQPAANSIQFNHVTFSANGHQNSTGTDTYGIYVHTRMSGLSVIGCRFGDYGEDNGNYAQTYGAFFNQGEGPLRAETLPLIWQGNVHKNDKDIVNAWVSAPFIAGNPPSFSDRSGYQPSAADTPGWSVTPRAPTGKCAPNGSLVTSSNANDPALSICEGGMFKGVAQVPSQTNLPLASNGNRLVVLTVAQLASFMGLNFKGGIAWNGTNFVPSSKDETAKSEAGGATGVIVIPKLTSGGVNGEIRVTNGVITGLKNPS